MDKVINAIHFQKARLLRLNRNACSTKYVNRPLDGADKEFCFFRKSSDKQPVSLQTETIDDQSLRDHGRSDVLIIRFILL